MSEWNELDARWHNLMGELETERGKLGAREWGIVVGFELEMQQFLVDLRELELDIQKGGPNPPKFVDRFKAIIQAFHNMASSGPGLPGQVGGVVMNKVWSHGVEAMTSFLERRADALKVDSWSIGVTAGFPTGVSGTVSVSFRKT